MRNTRVPGHGLIGEGAPHVVSETGEVVRVHDPSSNVGGYGRGLCSCGDLSDLLSSSTQRRKWHREHKAAVANPITH